MTTSLGWSSFLKLVLSKGFRNGYVLVLRQINQQVNGGVCPSPWVDTDDASILFSGISECCATTCQGLQGVPQECDGQDQQVEQGCDDVPRKHRAGAEEGAGENRERAYETSHGQLMMRIAIITYPTLYLSKCINPDASH